MGSAANKRGTVGHGYQSVVTKASQMFQLILALQINPPFTDNIYVERDALKVIPGTGPQDAL